MPEPTKDIVHLILPLEKNRKYSRELIMGKKKKTPTEKAELFWLTFRKTHRRRLALRIANAPTTDPLVKRHILHNIKHPFDRPQDSPFSSLEDMCVRYRSIIWLDDESTVGKALKSIEDLPTHDPGKYILHAFCAWSVKPEIALNTKKDPVVEEERTFEKRVIDTYKKRFQRISPIISQLNNLLNELDRTGKGLSSLTKAVANLQDEAAFYKEIVSIGSSRRKQVLKEWRISDRKWRSQDHWKVVISRAVKWLNPYVCKKKSCEIDCNKTHETTFRKVAQILSILYPEVWGGDIDSIANIVKQRYYSAIDVPVPFPLDF